MSTDHNTLTRSGSTRGITQSRAWQRDVPWLAAVTQNCGATAASYARLVQVDGHLWWTRGAVVGCTSVCEPWQSRFDQAVEPTAQAQLELPSLAAQRGFVLHSDAVNGGLVASLLMRRSQRLLGELLLHFPHTMARRDVLAALRDYKNTCPPELESDTDVDPNVDVAETRNTAKIPVFRGLSADPMHVMVDTRAPPAGAGQRLPWLDDERARRLWCRLRATEERVWTLDGAVARRVETLFAPKGVHIISLCAAERPRLSPRSLLSPSQRTIAEFYGHGATIAEIARSMDRSPATIRSHLRQVYSRLHVASRLDLARALLIFTDKT